MQVPLPTHAAKGDDDFFDLDGLPKRSSSSHTAAVALLLTRRMMVKVLPTKRRSHGKRARAVRVAADRLPRMEKLRRFNSQRRGRARLLRKLLLRSNSVRKSARLPLRSEI